jgi:hypothetical protein
MASQSLRIPARRSDSLRGALLVKVRSVILLGDKSALQRIAPARSLDWRHVAAVVWNPQTPWPGKPSRFCQELVEIGPIQRTDVASKLAANSKGGNELSGCPGQRDSNSKDASSKSLMGRDFRCLRV